jgi:predicted Rossmann-fold nucleotide-binding protein
MGAVAETVRDGGQSVVGVIPKALQPREVGEGREKNKVGFFFFSFAFARAFPLSSHFFSPLSSALPLN